MPLKLLFGPGTHHIPSPSANQRIVTWLALTVLGWRCDVYFFIPDVTVSHGNGTACLISMLGSGSKIIEANYKIYYNNNDDSYHFLSVHSVIGRSDQAEAES